MPGIVALQQGVVGLRTEGVPEWALLAMAVILGASAVGLLAGLISLWWRA